MNHLWRRNTINNWDNYTRLQAVAQAVYASAEKEYNDSLKDSLLSATQSNKWWSTLKSTLFGVDMTIPHYLNLMGLSLMTRERRQHYL